MPAISNASTWKDNAEIVSYSNNEVFSSIFYLLSASSTKIIGLTLFNANGDLVEFTNNSFAREENEERNSQIIYSIDEKTRKKTVRFFYRQIWLGFAPQLSIEFLCSFKLSLQN